VARRFFHVGGAAGTVAKTMSAYDMTFSDAIYGSAQTLREPRPLQTMLDHEYKLLIERLDKKLGGVRTFFSFLPTQWRRAVSSSTMNRTAGSGFVSKTDRGVSRARS